MFGIPVTVDIAIRVVGLALTIGGCAYENRVEIWKMTHKNTYKKLTTWCFYNHLREFEDWIYDYGYTDKKMLEGLDLFATKLHGMKDYQKAPAEVQKEANQALYKMYLDRVNEIKKYEEKYSLRG